MLLHPTVGVVSAPENFESLAHLFVRRLQKKLTRSASPTTFRVCQILDPLRRQQLLGAEVTRQ